MNHEDVTAETSELFRAVNQRIVELGAPLHGTIDLICECPDESCTQMMLMTLEEYAAARSDPSLRAVVPGHERPSSGKVAGRSDRYVLVRASVAPPAGRAVA